MKKILIVGANFYNKGAQSMLFVTVSEIKKRCPEIKIFFATTDIFEEDLFVFSRVFYAHTAKQIALGKHELYKRCKCLAKDIIKLISGKHNDFGHYKQLKKLIPDIDLIIDISGFNLGEKWSISTQEDYLDNIRLARKYQIPMILMPQSFGPFNYRGDKKYLLEEISELLTYPKVIFAREREGYDALVKGFGLSNVRLSSDLVLQSQEINVNDVYNNEIHLDVPEISAENAVGIVPNSQCFNHGDKEKIFKLYRSIIDVLLFADKDVYLFSTSSEDLTLCREICEMFDTNSKVHLILNDFSCLEYNLFVKQFQFLICSRFHGIVHAYRNGVPCIVLGWAIKYNELADLVNQGQYVFNIVDDEIEDEKINDAVHKMISSVENESENIKERVIEIQKDNCFEVLDEFLLV